MMDKLKERHMASESEPLDLEDLLKETGYSDIQQSIKHWLPEALRENLKVSATGDDRYKFKPLYQINNREKLLNLLRDHSEKGLGAVKMEDVQESYPRVEKSLKALGDKVISLTRLDKEVVLFYNSPEMALQVDEEFQKLWRSVSVEGLGDLDIEKHLHNAGITSMQDTGIVKRKAKKKTAKPRKKQARLLNEHLANSELLKEYDADGQLVEQQSGSTQFSRQS